MKYFKTAIQAIHNNLSFTKAKDKLLLLNHYYEIFYLLHNSPEIRKTLH